MTHRNRDPRHAIPKANGREYDALSRKSRGLLAVFANQTGLGKYWKRQYNKRQRRQARKENDNNIKLMVDCERE